MCASERRELVDWCYLRQAIECRVFNYFPIRAPLITGSLAVPYIHQWYEDALDTPMLETCDELDVLRCMQEWDRSVAELFGQLVDGNLRARARKIPHSVKLDSQSFHQFPFEAVPPEFWRLEEIYWFDSFAKSENETYAHILLDFPKLIELFPLKDLKSYLNAHKLDHNSIELPVELAEPSKVTGARRGRKVLGDWQAFEVEMFQRLSTGDASRKLEAFCLEMTEWCKTAGWRNIPRRSSVMKRISEHHRLYRQVRSKSPN